jgi:hypothetical protein
MQTHSLSTQRGQHSPGRCCILWLAGHAVFFCGHICMAHRTCPCWHEHVLHGPNSHDSPSYLGEREPHYTCSLKQILRCSGTWYCRVWLMSSYVSEEIGAYFFRFSLHIIQYFYMKTKVLRSLKITVISIRIHCAAVQKTVCLMDRAGLCPWDNRVKANNGAPPPPIHKNVQKMRSFAILWQQRVYWTNGRYIARLDV